MNKQSYGVDLQVSKQYLHIHKISLVSINKQENSNMTTLNRCMNNILTIVALCNFNHHSQNIKWLKGYNTNL